MLYEVITEDGDGLVALGRERDVLDDLDLSSIGPLVGEVLATPQELDLDGRVLEDGRRGIYLHAGS